MSIVLIVMLVIVLGILACFYLESYFHRIDDDLPSYEIVGLEESEEDAIGPQYSEEKKAFMEKLNQLMRFQLEMDSIE